MVTSLHKKVGKNGRWWGMEIFFVGSVNGNGNLLEDRNGGFKCMFQRTAEIDWGHMHIHPSLFFFFFENFNH